MLNRGVGGAWGFSTDIGGYLGDTPKELFFRWSQWAALSPYFRLHNSSSNGTRQP
jgi:alpha-D-xyloside xylohydrolase